MEQRRGSAPCGVVGGGSRAGLLKNGPRKHSAATRIPEPNTPFPSRLSLRLAGLYRHGKGVETLAHAVQWVRFSGTTIAATMPPHPPGGS